VNADDLKKFCADANDIRAHMMGRPWSRGEWTWATNGHILLRVSRQSDVAENDAAPDCAALLAKVPAAVNWIPVPECASLPDIECDECGGTGIATCPTCCNDSDCGNCDHTGMVRQRRAVEAGDAHFDQNYLAALQGYEIATNGPSTAAHIRNGDIIGLLMPMRPK